MAIDQAANIKGFLGRHPRPGYAEWQGTRGTLVHRATGHAWGDSSTTATELRRCSEDAFEDAATGRRGHGRADQITAVHLEIVDRRLVLHLRRHAHRAPPIRQPLPPRPARRAP